MENKCYDNEFKKKKRWQWTTCIQVENKVNLEREGHLWSRDICSMTGKRGLMMIAGPVFSPDVESACSIFRREDNQGSSLQNEEPVCSRGVPLICIILFFPIKTRAKVKERKRRGNRREKLVHEQYSKKRGCCSSRLDNNWPVSKLKGKFRPQNDPSYPLTFKNISKNKGMIPLRAI